MHGTKYNAIGQPRGALLCAKCEPSYNACQEEYNLESEPAAAGSI